jgi:hypothetical protein
MIKINMGCGWRDFGKDWIHIDGGDYPHLDSKDIFNLSYNDNSVDLIYVSHVIEYFNSGILRLAVPDFKNISFLYHTYDYPLETFLGPLYGKMPMGDKTIYHKTTYDFNSLKSLLESLDMRNVVEYDWRKTEHSKFDDHSQAYIPHMDKDHGTLISLNVECTK